MKHTSNRNHSITSKILPGALKSGQSCTTIPQASGKPPKSGTWRRCACCVQAAHLPQKQQDRNKLLSACQGSSKEEAKDFGASSLESIKEGCDTKASGKRRRSQESTNTTAATDDELETKKKRQRTKTSHIPRLLNAVVPNTVRCRHQANDPSYEKAVPHRVKEGPPMLNHSYPNDSPNDVMQKLTVNSRESDCNPPTQQPRITTVRRFLVEMKQEARRVTHLERLTNNSVTEKVPKERNLRKRPSSALHQVWNPTNKRIAVLKPPRIVVTRTMSDVRMERHLSLEERAQRGSRIPMLTPRRPFGALVASKSMMTLSTSSADGTFGNSLKIHRSTKVSITGHPSDVPFTPTSSTNNSRRLSPLSLPNGYDNSAAFGAPLSGASSAAALNNFDCASSAGVSLDPAVISSGHRAPSSGGTVRIRLLGSAASVCDVRSPAEVNVSVLDRVKAINSTNSSSSSNNNNKNEEKHKPCTSVPVQAGQLGRQRRPTVTDGAESRETGGSVLVAEQKTGGKYQSCRNLSVNFGQQTVPVAGGAGSNSRSLVAGVKRKISSSGAGSEANWTEESFKEYITELQSEYGALKSALSSLDHPESAKTEDTAVPLYSNSSKLETLGRSLAKMDELLRRVANLNSILGSSRLAEVSIREKLKTMNERELHLTKVIEEQSGLVEVAKKKMAKMAKDIGEERRKRKDGEKKFAEEKQDLKEQNELLEFRLLELDASKQQHQGLFDEARAEMVQRLESVAHQGPSEWSSAVFGLLEMIWGGGEEGGHPALAGDVMEDSTVSDFLAPSDQFAARLLEDTEDCSEGDFNRLWRIAMSFLDYVEAVLTQAEKNYKHLQSENARIQDELAEALAGQYPVDPRCRLIASPCFHQHSHDTSEDEKEDEVTSCEETSNNKQLQRCVQETEALAICCCDINRKMPTAASPTSLASSTMASPNQHQVSPTIDRQSSLFSDAQSFQESGIFDGGSCISVSDGAVSESTQTDEFDSDSHFCPHTKSSPTGNSEEEDTDVELADGKSSKKKLVKSKPKSVAVNNDDSDSVGTGGADSPIDDEENSGFRRRVGAHGSTILVKKLQNENAKLGEEANDWKVRAENLANDVEQMKARILQLEDTEREAKMKLERLESQLNQSSTPPPTISNSLKATSPTTIVSICNENGDRPAKNVEDEGDWCEIVPANESSQVTVIKLGSPSPVTTSPSPNHFSSRASSVCGEVEFINANNAVSDTSVTKIEVTSTPSLAPTVDNKVSFRIGLEEPNFTNISIEEDISDIEMVSSRTPPTVTSCSTSCSPVTVTSSAATSTPVSSSGANLGNKCRPGTAHDREKFYLGKIKALQAERNQLRKDAEKEKQKALTASDQLAEAIREGQCKLEALATSLSQVQVAKDDLEYKTSVEKKDLEKKLQDLSNQGDVWRSECKILAEKCDHLEAELARSREYAESVEASCASLKDLAYLWQILGVTEEEVLSAENSVKGEVQSEVNSVDTNERLVDKYVHGIRAKVAELQKKDTAYQQTLREADNIVADVEQRYQAQIADLQTEEKKLHEKIGSLEQICNQLQRSLKPNSGPPTTPGSGMEREMGLLEKLVDAENSAMKWKEKVFDMEKSERSSSVKIMELEKKIADLKMDLRDQEDLLSKINHLQGENSQLHLDNNLLAPVRRQLLEVKSKNKLLEARVEELEDTEKTLQQTLDQATSLLKSKDMKFQSEVSDLRRRLDQTRVDLEAKESEEQRWRSEAQSLKELLASKDSDAKRKGDMLTSMEETHRSEMSRLGTQLRTAKDHLLQVDRTNASLQEELRAMSDQLVALQAQLQREENKYERSLLQFNLQLVSKDDEIQQLNGQLRDAKENMARRELDMLADKESRVGCDKGEERGVGLLQKRMAELKENLKNCPSCADSEQSTLHALESQIRELGDILSGSSPPTSGEEGCLLLPLSLGEEMSTAAGMASGLASPEWSTRTNGSGEGNMSDIDKEVMHLKERLQQAEEEGAVLANQLRRVKEDLLTEKEESARLLVEVANRKKRQAEANDSLRHENSALRDEIGSLRQDMATMQYQYQQLDEQHQRLLNRHQLLSLPNDKRRSSGRNLDFEDSRNYTSLPPSSSVMESSTSSMTSSLLAPIAEVEDYMRALSVSSKKRNSSPDVDRFLQQQERAGAGGVSRGPKKATWTNSMPSDAASPYAITKSSSTSVMCSPKRVSPTGTSRIPKPLPSGALKRSHSMSVKSCTPAQHPMNLSFSNGTSNSKRNSPAGTPTVSSPTSDSSSGAPSPPVASHPTPGRWRSASASSGFSYSSSSIGVTHGASSTNSSASSGSSSGPNSLEDDILHHHQQQKAAATQQPQAKKNPLRRSCSSVVTRPSMDFNGNTEMSPPAIDRICQDLSLPEKFRVTRFVGDDGVLVAWEPPLDTRIAGYKIYVDQEFHSKVRSPQRTKALICGIERLKVPGALVIVDIRSVNIDGSVSRSASTRISVPPPAVPARKEDLLKRRQTMPNAPFDESNC